jgi:beta-lactamase class A
MRRAAFVGLLTAGCIARPPAVVEASGDALVWYAADLRGTRTFSSGADHVLPAASVIKLLIARTLVDAVSTGRLSLDSRIPLAARDRVRGSDKYGEAAPGLYPVADLLAAMLSMSDNTASNALLQRLGAERCNSRAAASGLAATRIRRRFYDWKAQRRGLENTTTPRESALLLVELAHRAHERGPAGEAARAVMNALLAQTDRETIPAALPRRRAIANKTGELPGVRNDVAIVGYGQGDAYVVSVMDRYGSARSSAIQKIRSVVKMLDRRLDGI